MSVVLLVGCDDSTPNKPPRASFTISTASGPPPLSVTFDASSSSDNDGSIATYEWQFGDGATGSGRTVEYTYAESGAYDVRLTVTDDDGAEADATDALVVNVLPSGRIEADPVGGEAPVTVTFDASASADEDGEIVSYDWDFGGTAQASGATAEHTFADAGVYEVRLTVTDDLGGTAEVVFEMNAREVDGEVPYMVPYVSDATYAEQLRPCTYMGTATERCTLARLPFIGMEHPEPTVDDVMARVLVSHRWMGDSLRDVLERLPADVRLLARSVTAIVIASDIRPAHYSPATGSIRLDGDFFWRTLEERAVVTQEQDYRSGFGATIGVYLPWRLVNNNAALVRSAPPGESRSEAPLPRIAFLLYHELSHAADFMEASRLDDLDEDQTPWPSMVGNFLEWPSTRLSTERPLRSRVMRELAAVFFLGVEPTPDQEALRPDDIVDEFALDGAVDFYSYSTQYEALADISHALLMSYHHDHEQDIAVVDREGRTTPQSIVAWGQRGRIADEAVIDRARLVIDELYPGDAQALHGYLNARPAPLPMRRGDSWADNLVLEGGASSSPLAVLSGSARPRANVPTGQHATQPNFVGCILVPEGGPAAFRESLGLR